MSRPAAFLFCLVLAPSLLAQEQPAAPRAVSFDVVSIKRHHPEESGPARFNSGITPRPDGGITMTNVTVAVIIGRAYTPISPVDLPPWTTSERYDVAATASLPRATAAERAAMLRAMLADRFKLVARVETREEATYDLVVARKDGRLGPGLRAVDKDCAREIAARAAAAAEGTRPAPSPQMPDFTLPPPSCSLRTVSAALRGRQGGPSGPPGDLIEGETTMTVLATALRMSTIRRVVDRTGLAGSYRVTMHFDGQSGRRGPDVDPPPDAGPSVFSAVQEQLGLKLESSRAPADVLVIDRLERPSEN